MSSIPPTLDRTDKRILATLQHNARISNLELAELVGLSATPCARRVKRLEDCGIIQSHITVLDETLLGLSLTALISISMDRHTPDRFANFEKIISDFPEIIEWASKGLPLNFIIFLSLIVFDPALAGIKTQKISDLLLILTI